MYLDRVVSKSLLYYHRLPATYLQDEMRALFSDYRRTINDPIEGTWLFGRKVENWRVTFRLIHSPRVLHEFPADLDWSFEWYMQHNINYLKGEKQPTLPLYLADLAIKDVP